MDLFHIIDDGVAILRVRGVFRQAKVFRRGRDVYAGYGSGFIKLGPSSGTSVPHISWLGVQAEGVSHGVGGQPRWTSQEDAETREAA